MKIGQSLIYRLYQASVLYYTWLLYMIGQKVWPQLMSLSQMGATSSGVFLIFIQSFLLWIHWVILRGIFRQQAWALMASLLMAGIHTLCAIALPGVDIYTRTFLWVSLTVFVVSLAQFFSQLAELRA